MKHLFIINPAAGKGKALKIIPEIQRIFRDYGEEYVIEVTKGPGHAAEIAKQYSANENCRIYSVGGDGTLNEVLNGMVNSGSSLGVIPGGSGNDFIKSIYSLKDDENIVERTVRGKEEYLDLGRVNNRYFINISSVGIDAEVVYNARELKKTPLVSGHMAYLLSIFATVFKFKSRPMEITIDNKNISNNTLLFAVANGVYYGGGMKIAPKADLKDGAFEICHVREVGKTKILRLFPRVIKGEHHTIDEVSFFNGKKVVLSCEEEFTLNVDGELFRAKEAEFEIISKGIKVIMPE